MRFPNLSSLPLFSSKPDNDSDVEYASFSSRSFAVTIDLLVLFLLLTPIFSFISNLIFPNFLVNGGELKVQQIFMSLAQGTISLSEAMAELSKLGLFAKMSVDYSMQLISAGIIIVFAWVKWDTTLGLLLFRSYIADAKTGGKPTLQQYIIRYIVGVFSIGAIFGVMLMFFNKRKMALHDMVAGTVVLHRKFRWKAKVADNEVEDKPSE